MKYKVGVAQWCLDREGAASVARAAELGFEAVHLGAGTPGRDDYVGSERLQAEYADRARRHGVEIGALAMNVLETYGMTGPPGTELARRCEAVIRSTIDAAARMGVPLVYAPSFHANEIRDRRGLERTGEVLREACAYAQGRGVMVVSENTLGAEGNSTLVGLVGHPQFRILVDVYNPMLWGHRVPDLIRAVRAHMCGQVHVKDGRGGAMGNAPLGEGEGGFAEAARALREVGFNGVVILENDYTTDAERRVRQDRNALARHLPLAA